MIPGQGVDRDVLLAQMAAWLQPARFKDYCPNGLQVEGRQVVRTIISGVTACQALLDAAVEEGADMVLVHHGYFWRGEDARITGMRRRRLATLLVHDINLVAWHLPLDAQPDWGNNVSLATEMGWQVDGRLDDDPECLIWRGRLPAPVRAVELAAQLAHVLGRTPVHIGEPDACIETLAWCTGGAQGYIDRAAAAGVDAYISGEISEQTVHVAREMGIHYFAAGHHATERYGVQALGQALARQFGVIHRFVDVDSPA